MCRKIVQVTEALTISEDNSIMQRRRHKWTANTGGEKKLRMLQDTKPKLAKKKLV